MMYALLLATALFAADDQTQNQERTAVSSRHIDGTWQVVYVEAGGKPLTPATGHGSVTIQNNTVCFRDMALQQPGTEAQSPATEAGRQSGEAGRRGTAVGMQQSWRLEFGPNQTVRATPVSGPAEVNGRRQSRDQDNDQDRSREEKSDPTQGRAQNAAQRTQSGVYILSREYLCLSLRGSGSHGRTPTPESGQTGEQGRDFERSQSPTREATAGHQAAGPSGKSFIVILRRGHAEGQPGSER
jgi:hypothetical protein